jgi:hypothetical protein
MIEVEVQRYIAFHARGATELVGRRDDRRAGVYGGGGGGAAAVDDDRSNRSSILARVV